MGKTRRERRYLKKIGCLPPTNNEKIVLTSRQLENLITRENFVLCFDIQRYRIIEIQKRM